MNNRTKVVIAVATAGIPVMLFFQNCAKATNPESLTGNDGVATETVIGKSAPIDSNNLPLNQELAFNSKNQQVALAASEEGAAEDDVGFQVEDREVEREKDIKEALLDCESLALNAEAEGSGGVLPPEGPIDVRGIRSSRVLSPADFGGLKKINSISNSYGKIVLCDLEVDLVSQTGGKLILIGSSIKKIISHHGTVDLVDGSAVIDGSNVKIFRTSLEGGQ